MKTTNKSLDEITNISLRTKYKGDYSILSGLLNPTIGIRQSKHKRISKFGGNPLLQEEFDLDAHIDDHLTFLCQISVQEYHQYDIYDYLPNDRIIYFFINKDIGYPITKNDFKVFSVSSNNDTLKEVQRNSRKKFDEIYIEFFTHYNFPSYQCYKLLELNHQVPDLDEKIDEIQEFINDYNNISEGHEGSQLFGNPQAVQGTVSFHWALKSLNLDFQLSDKDMNKVKEREKEFVLLLQVDTSQLNLTNDYGDGIVYFGIRETDLAVNNFNSIELIYQTT